MPFKIVCPAGHRLVLAGAVSERPSVCPRCGLPLEMDLETDSLRANCRAPVGDTAKLNGQNGAGLPGRSDIVDLPATTHDRPACLPPVIRQLPVIRVQSEARHASRFGAGAGLLTSILLVAAVACAVPAFMELAASLVGDRAGSITTLDRWALALAWLGGLQAAYAAYGWLWCDNSSWRIVTLALVVQAGFYAAVLAIVLLARPQGWILGDHGLQLAGMLEGGQAALACLSLVCLYATLAMFSARHCLANRVAGGR